MNIRTTSNFEKRYRKLKVKNKKLSLLLDKMYVLLIKNPHHPSLHLHKLSGREGVWSVSVNRSIRVLFTYVSKDVEFFDIGSHDEVYEQK